MVKRALEEGAVDKLLFSEGLKAKDLKAKCKKCRHEWDQRVKKTSDDISCPECAASGEAIRVLETSSVFDTLSKNAEASNTEVIIISTDTEEGSQLMLGFGGLAAILRYPWM